MLLSVVSHFNTNITLQHLKFDLATWVPFFDDGWHTFANSFILFVAHDIHSRCHNIHGPNIWF
jgi:hypothetical protein